jgi:hypothetical protein
MPPVEIDFHLDPEVGFVTQKRMETPPVLKGVQANREKLLQICGEGRKSTRRLTLIVANKSNGKSRIKKRTNSQ